MNIASTISTATDSGLVQGRRTRHGRVSGVNVGLGVLLLICVSACAACRATGSAPSSAQLPDPAVGLVVYADDSAATGIHAAVWQSFVKARGVAARWIDEPDELVRIVQEVRPRATLILLRATADAPSWATALREQVRQNPEAVVGWVLCQEPPGPHGEYSNTTRGIVLWTYGQTLLVSHDVDRSSERLVLGCEVSAGLHWPQVSLTGTLRPAVPGARGSQPPSTGYTRAGAGALFESDLADTWESFARGQSQCEALGPEWSKSPGECWRDVSAAFASSLWGASQRYERGLDLAIRSGD